MLKKFVHFGVTLLRGPFSRYLSNHGLLFDFCECQDCVLCKVYILRLFFNMRLYYILIATMLHYGSQIPEAFSISNHDKILYQFVIK